MKESEKWAKCFTLGPLLENCARLSRCLREQGILHGAADTDCPWKTDKPRRVAGGGGTKHTNVEALVLMRNMRHRQWTQKTVCLAVYVLRRIQMDGGEGDYAAGLLFQSLILFFCRDVLSRKHVYVNCCWVAISFFLINDNVKLMCNL